MSTLGEKIGILLENNELSQAQLAKKMYVSASTVQKWVKGKNMPKTDTVIELCNMFYVPIEKMLDENYEIPEYIWLERRLPERERLWPKECQDSPHDIYDADLSREGRLHRFKKAGGALCSAIYIGRDEVWWHYREHEARMIRDWNREYGHD